MGPSASPSLSTCGPAPAGAGHEAGYRNVPKRSETNAVQKRMEVCCFDSFRARFVHDLEQSGASLYETDPF